MLRCLNEPGLPHLVQLRNPHGEGEWVGEYSDNDTARWTPDLMAATGYDPCADGDDGIFWIPFKAWLQSFDGVDVVPRVRLGEEGGWTQVLATGSFSPMPTPVGNYESAGSATQFLLALEASASVHITVRQDTPGDGEETFRYNLLVQRREAGQELEKPVEVDMSKDVAVVLAIAKGEHTNVLELEAGIGYAIIPFLEEPTPSASGFSVNVAARAPFTLRMAQPGEEGSQLLEACT